MAELRPGRPEAAAVIWDWGSARAEPDARVARPRRRGALQALAGLCVGTGVFFWHSPVMGAVIASVALTIGLAALLSPRGLYAGIERGFEALGRVVGRALTWLTMFVIFYAIFLPFGALFRRGRRDPLRRFYEADASTYWERRELGRSASASPERQY